ncbi:Sec-independent protein translocase protein TatB [Acetobacter senegalensis]|uniref:Sec-independent protein translocase protein TatB n=1 Tax=Acetobacter senegalensis TaxID=446692 RepID=UPI0027D30CB0|nr:Sec-independent protein translocase protein TatB [Acetobacter senegalensis]MCG4254197.1 Sec-independent protein translocase protein TatB [Acetobacter senegalensis]
MFDFAWSEIALIGAVALVVIGPKDLPVAIRGLAKAVKKARNLAGEFQSHVDEMVREADLGEVREHMRDLRNLNVRGRIMKAIDSDGSLKRTFESSPLDGPVMRAPAGPRALDAAPAHTPGAPAGSSAMLEERSVGLPSLPPVPGGQSTLYDYDSPSVLEELEDAPPELPPGIVRRIVRERERLFPPAILPPVRVLHGGRSVAPGPGGPAAGDHTGSDAAVAQAASGSVPPATSTEVEEKPAYMPPEAHAAMHATPTAHGADASPSAQPDSQS